MRRLLLRLAELQSVRDTATRLGPVQRVVDRFVAGETLEACLAVVRRLADAGQLATVDHLGEHTDSEERARAQAEAYVTLLHRLARERLAPHAEVSVKASALGLLLPGGDELAWEGARRVAAAARDAGTTVTVDMEDHPTTDATLALVRRLRRDFPDTGVVLQAMLRRSTGDLEELAVEGSRVRWCKGAYAEPAAVAHTGRPEVDRAYLAGLRRLLKSPAYPMIATHDPAMIEAALAYLDLLDRRPDSYEFQMLLGVRTDEMARLAASGHRVRVYVPYGVDWYAYFMRRLAERPANLALLGRALVSRR